MSVLYTAVNVSHMQFMQDKCKAQLPSQEAVHMCKNMRSTPVSCCTCSAHNLLLYLGHLLFRTELVVTAVISLQQGTGKALQQLLLRSQAKQVN